MQIAVIAACLRQDMPADTGRVATEIILAMCRQQPAHQFICFFDGDIPAGLNFPANVTTVVVPLKGEKPWHLYWWLEWQLPRAMKAYRPDLMIGLDGTLPLRSKIPGIILLRDLSFLRDAGLQPVLQQRRLKKNLDKYLARASRIVVLSDTVKEELSRHAPAIKDKIVRVTPGVSPLYQPLEWESREAVKREFTGSAEYFLVAGSLHPRNNIIPVLKAFSALKRRQRSNIRLVLAGSLTEAGADIATALQSYKFRQDVVWLEHLDESTLARLTGAAYALVYTARLDGLPLAVYAAGRCQVPVIALDGAAVREAGGEAVLYTDPANLDDLAEKMSLLYKDEQLRSRLLAKIPPVMPAEGWEQAAGEIGTLLTGG
ncbi:glycosyltransferase family 4 protein [Chitinophaga nivalis]|uniref:Glycosyltransferase family 4 protein n=1 Tax=Chitinophaga nivalis TaxID=2991709 RepID=A0ABT3IW31_9BACT|nr:glycosyltransferase family 1 protein [Chitinophaga nivalis]MCW3462126.1 glycosyltransferase family 4 protein [Chitinophaga nivalis]MCW3488182.1 glycosyltransferase family 4 protein [Chitinophaga nivalis]